MKKNNNVEEINTSINNLLEEWNISDDHNEKVVNHIIGLQMKKIIRVTFQQIQKYEKGANLPNPVRLLALSQYFKVPFYYWIKPILDKDLTILSNKYYFNKKEDTEPKFSVYNL